MNVFHVTNRDHDTYDSLGVPNIKQPALHQTLGWILMQGLLSMLSIRLLRSVLYESEGKLCTMHQC